MRIMRKVTDGEEGAVWVVGRNDLMDLLGLSTAMISHLERDGVVVRTGRDSYDLWQSVQKYAAKLRASAAGRGADEDDAANLTRERALLAREQRIAQEMKNEVNRGALVEAAEVERAWGDFLREVRSRMTGVPSRVRQSVVVGPDVVVAMDAEIRRALQSLGEDGDD